MGHYHQRDIGLLQTIICTILVPLEDLPYSSLVMKFQELAREDNGDANIS